MFLSGLRACFLDIECLIAGGEFTINFRITITISNLGLWAVELVKVGRSGIIVVYISCKLSEREGRYTRERNGLEYGKCSYTPASSA